MCWGRRSPSQGQLVSEASKMQQAELGEIGERTPCLKITKHWEPPLGIGLLRFVQRGLFFPAQDGWRRPGIGK